MRCNRRVTQNADIHMADVFVPDTARLTGVNSFKDTNKVGVFRQLDMLSIKEV